MTTVTFMSENPFLAAFFGIVIIFLIYNIIKLLAEALNMKAKYKTGDKVWLCCKGCPKIKAVIGTPGSGSLHKVRPYYRLRIERKAGDCQDEFLNEIETNVGYYQDELKTRYF